MVQIIASINGVPIRLTDERWQHIASRHIEMSTMREQVLQTISQPDVIQKGDAGELLAIRFYLQTPLTQKFLVVAYQESRTDGFVITAYLTRRPSNRREIIWKR